MSHNILVVRLSSLGDIVLTGPVYKNLKSHWPDCRITVLVKPQYVPVLEGNPCVDEVVPFHGLRDALRRIREGRFTHLLDLHSTFRSFLLRRLSGVPETLCYRKDALARRLWVSIGRPSPALAKHTIDRYLECLGEWKVPTPRRSVELGDYRVRPEALAEPQRLLVVQTAFLGDATLTVPLAREIKRLAPGSRLAVLCRRDTADIYRSSPWVDEALVDDKRGEHGGLSGLWKLVADLRARAFDLAVVPHRSLRSALAVWLAGIPRRVGFSNSAGSFLFTRVIPFTWGMHDLERNLGLLLPWTPSNSKSPAASTASGDSGRSPEDSVYLRPGRNPAAAAAVAGRLARAGVSEGIRLAGVHPGSVWPTKRWPADRYAALIRRLVRETKTPVVLVGGSDDAALACGIARSADVPTLDWTGKTDLPELIELMPRLALFVTNDSGPMHVAAASGVPTLALFGPTTRELGFFPYGSSHRVLEADLACRPCGLHGNRTCPEGHFLCMRLISVDRAFRAAAEMLSAPDAREREAAEPIAGRTDS